MANSFKDKAVKNRAFFFFTYFRDLAYGMFIDVAANPKAYSGIRNNAFDRLESAYKAYEAGKSDDVVRKIARGQSTSKIYDRKI